MARTLTTAYMRPSITLVTTGTTPQLEQMWNCAVFVPNSYLETRDGSLTDTLSDPVGHEVQTPPCFTQNVQPQARAGIADGSGFHVSSKEMLPQ